MDIQIDAILKSLRDTIGTQAQEIAVLKATLEAYQTPPAVEPVVEEN